MDLARIVASIMVIFMHVTAAWKYDSYDIFEWKISIVYDCLSRSAVPLFFMLSGAFTKANRIKKNWSKILNFSCIFFVSSIAYTISDYLYSNLYKQNAGGGI